MKAREQLKSAAECPYAVFIKSGVSPLVPILLRVGIQFILLVDWVSEERRLWARLIRNSCETNQQTHVSKIQNAER